MQLLDSCRRTSLGARLSLKRAGLWSCAKRHSQVWLAGAVAKLCMSHCCGRHSTSLSRRCCAEQFWSTEALGMGIFYTLNVFIMQFYLGAHSACTVPAAG